MSESFPALLAFIGLLAIVLGALRGELLRSRGFVPRGRKLDAVVADSCVPSTERERTVSRARQRRPRLVPVPSAAETGAAR